MNLESSLHSLLSDHTEQAEHFRGVWWRVPPPTTGGGDALTSSPPRPEQKMNPYFAHLYQVSSNGGGALTQSDFITFLKKSGLGKQDLSSVWKCCMITGAEVSREEFCVAMGAVGVLQASPNSPVTREYVLGVMSGGGALPVPAFEGVPRPSLPAPAASSLGGGGPSFSISPDDQEKYNRIFASTDTDGDGFVLGGEAVALFTKSGLEKGVLKSIWSLSDLDKDNRLDHPEFCVAMHLVVSLSKRGMQLPTTLPPELVPASKAHLVAPSSGAGAAALPPPPAAAPAIPAQSFKAMSLDDAFSSASIDIGLPVPAPAPPAHVVEPTPPPVVVEAAPPPPPPTAPITPPTSSYSPEQSPSSHAFAPAPVVPSLQSYSGAAAAAPAPAPSYSVAQQQPSYPTGTASGGSSPPHPTVAAVAGDLEAAMSSQVRRENVLLEAKRDMVSGAAGDLRRLEQERNVFLGQVERLRAACAEEDGEYAGIVGKIEAVRKEIAGLRGVELKSSAGYEERLTRKVEAKGVLATLVATLVAEGGRAEELEGELRALVEKALGQELGAARLATGAAQLQGVAQQHGTAAEGAEEGAAALRLALTASQARVRALEGERGALEAKLKSAGVNFEAATQALVQAERDLDTAKARHLESIKAKMEALVASSHAQGRVSALEEATASLRELGGEVTRGVPRAAAASRPAPATFTASPSSSSSFSASSSATSSFSDTSLSFTSSAPPPPPRQDPTPVAPAAPAAAPVAAPPAPPTPAAPTPAPAPAPTPPAPIVSTPISSAFDDDDLFNMASSSSSSTLPTAASSLDAVAPTPALPPPAPSDAFGFDDAAFPVAASNPTPSSGGMGGGGDDFGSAFDAEFDTKAAVAASSTGDDDWPVETKAKVAPPAEDAFTW